jgi:hypothetical protein
LYSQLFIKDIKNILWSEYLKLREEWLKMNFNELANKIIGKYGGKLWAKPGIARIYFNHTSKVDTYIEFDVFDGKVEDISDIYSGCKYIGKPVTSYKWIENYTHEAREYIEEIKKFILDLMEDY